MYLYIYIHIYIQPPPYQRGIPLKKNFENQSKKLDEISFSPKNRPQGSVWGVGGSILTQKSSRIRFRAQKRAEFSRFD